ncbi:hypothetical protein RJ640_009013 [Escallonia rubra]|uniref:allene-oxide cyclase n=1 Tax=Escallonia rubra TaxID=112253 RepID=A0AA88RAC3_9ASTE|nr:hypothetical protein RJ640_009013 [Escallonia rubra]
MEQPQIRVPTIRTPLFSIWFQLRSKSCMCMSSTTETVEAQLIFVLARNLSIVLVILSLSATKDTYLAVTGGSGVFEGAYGQVKLHGNLFPFKLFYTFYLKGIQDLPRDLLCTPVAPWPTVEPSAAAKACEPGATIPNFTD